jgi:hypothetical protein
MKKRRKRGAPKGRAAVSKEGEGKKLSTKGGLRAADIFKNNKKPGRSRQR